jgi:hypothetical protein
MATENPTFIGLEALQQICVKYQPQIIMGAAHYRPDVFTRMKIKVSTGLRFKDVQNVMNRKGHTTQRKVVGAVKPSTLGYMEERVLTGFLSVNQYRDNKDNYIETPVTSDDPDNVTYSYPMSEIAFKAAVANYGEDLFDCLWHGDDEIEYSETDEHGTNYLRLYCGLVTYIRRDKSSGRISKENGNYAECDSITEPVDVTDITAYTNFKKWRAEWKSTLRNAPEVLVYCTEETGAAIAAAYGNSKSNNDGVRYNDDMTFKIPEWRNITFCPESSFGEGDLLIATTPENFEYGVDSKDSRNTIMVQKGSDSDLADIIFQIQSIQGTRVINVNASNFCMSNGNLEPSDIAGDFLKSTFVVVSSNDSDGTVQVNSSSPENNKEYKVGTELTLKATNASGTFSHWLINGKKYTTETVKVTTEVRPGYAIAMFTPGD